MRNGISSKQIAEAIRSVGAWVMDMQKPPALIGQRCDRLRPAPIGKELRAALQANDHGSGELVEWHWDQRQARAEGWLWNNGVLQEFRWSRRDGRLIVRAQLRCTAQTVLQLLV
jgi:hypothetical protein